MSDTAQEVRENPALQVAGRIGMLFYGAVHLLIAWLAAQVVFGDRAQSDSKGALAEISKSPIGPALLWALAIGLFLFVLWQLAEAAVGFTYVHKERKRTGKRIGAVARSVTATFIGVGAVQFALGSGSTDSTGRQQALTARVLALPFGQVLVGAVALGILIIAIVVFRKGVKRSFTEDLNLSTLPDGSQRWVKRIGRIGWTGKGLAYGVIGVLVATAAVTADPEESGGLDKALHTLAGEPWGVGLLVLIAVGLAAFGVYCFAAARAHRV
ncbi:Membrane protein, putative [Alloactinosynnema sp. L-07]|uniref:DUF1206 domain-containing protein n=1 Tax=Alloactinosynnema sp. L-07 TaxID=1653480 RepID=UPI00065F071D|nr:DUF1206 domain-containing protein [Alloactinosynnema sp. L-07]CRK57392.1 Membrane protein, putative [Alloactinosynnema sp. L-07]